MGDAVKPKDGGMTLIEVVLATFFLTISLLAVAGSMAAGISATYVTQEQLIAKQKAQEALESVMEARNTQQIGFSQIQSTANGGVFVTGFQPIENMGVDGIPNTADDSGPVETISYPGPDGKLGTADDVTVSLTNYKRQITITQLTLPADTTIDPDIVRIDIDVQYVVRNVTKTVRVTSYVSRFS